MICDGRGIIFHHILSAASSVVPATSMELSNLQPSLRRLGWREDPPVAGRQTPSPRRRSLFRGSGICFDTDNRRGFRRGSSSPLRPLRKDTHLVCDSSATLRRSLARVIRRIGGALARTITTYDPGPNERSFASKSALAGGDRAAGNWSLGAKLIELSSSAPDIMTFWFFVDLPEEWNCLCHAKLYLPMASQCRLFFRSRIEDSFSTVAAWWIWERWRAIAGQ